MTYKSIRNIAVCHILWLLSNPKISRPPSYMNTHAYLVCKYFNIPTIHITTMTLSKALTSTRPLLTTLTLALCECMCVCISICI